MTAYESALKAIEVAQSTMEIAGTRAYELYRNLLSDEPCQAWEKNIKTKINVAPWEDLKGAVQQEERTTTWDYFLECIMLHLLQVLDKILEKPLNVTL